MYCCVIRELSVYNSFHWEVAKVWALVLRMIGEYRSRNLGSRAVINTYRHSYLLMDCMIITLSNE